MVCKDLVSAIFLDRNYEVQVKIVMPSSESHSTEGRREVVHSLLTAAHFAFFFLPSIIPQLKASGRPGPATGRRVFEV